MARAVAPERPIAVDDVVDALVLGLRRACHRPAEPVDARDGSTEQAEPDGKGGERHRVRHHVGAHRRSVKTG